MKFTPLGDLWHKVPAPPNCFINPGILPTGSLLAIVGEPGQGKSFLAQQTAFELACGKRWVGLFSTKEAKVGYLELEKQTPITQLRIHREDWKKLYPKAGENLGYFDSGKLYLDTQRDTQILGTMITDMGCNVVVIDSFNVTVANENDPENMKIALNNYRWLTKTIGVAFVMVVQLRKRGHAYDHKASKFVEPPLSLDDLRGSKLFEYEIDSAVGITRTGAGATRNFAFLKHSHSPVEYMSKTPLSLQYNAATAPPFKTRASDVIEILEKNDNQLSYTEIEKALDIERPTLKKLINKLSEYEVVYSYEGGGGSKGYVYLV